jgi:hypothetical protein
MKKGRVQDPPFSDMYYVFQHGIRLSGRYCRNGYYRYRKLADDERERKIHFCHFFHVLPPVNVKVLLVLSLFPVSIIPVPTLRGD